MVKSKIIPLFPSNPQFEQLITDVQNPPIKPSAVTTYGHNLHDFRLPTYSQGQHCPNCGRRAWNIQRTQAECGKCGEVLPLRRGGN